MIFRRVLATSTIAFSLAMLPGWSQPAPKGGELQVHTTYTGSGTVDGKHKLYVVLWDTPEFTNNETANPIAIQPLLSKDGTVKFENVAKTPVYVSIAYDPTGKWEARTVPPAGTSLGLYAKVPGTPAPVEMVPGKITKISATLDDSFKAPAR